MHYFISSRPIIRCIAITINLFFILLAYSAIGQDVSLIDKLKENKISIIEINTAWGAQIVSKEEYLTASYTLYTYKNGSYTVTSDTTEIKGRGNSTWNWPKKPFRLKLKNAKSLLSMPSSKHWALLANFTDKTLSRNKVAMDVGGFWGLPYNPKSEVVELVVNGWHWGSYQLIEVPKIATDRVNITTINSKSDTPGGGVIFELDGRLGEQYYFWTNQYLPITIKDPDDLNTTNASIANSHLEYASNIFKNAEDVLFGSNFTDPVNGYPKYIDTSSVYNWYLTQEIFKNIDLSRYSVYFYNDTKNNNKITFGPLWDFDMSSGVLEDPYGIRGTENLWISRLYEDPAFINAIKAKWNKKRADLLELITNKVNENARKLHYSQKVNFDFWNQFYGVITEEYTSFHQEASYENDIFYFKKWMNQRLHWLDQQFSTTPYHFIPVTKDVYHVENEDGEVRGKLEAFQSFENTGKYKIVQTVKNGDLVLDENTGAYTYTPKLNFYGTDTAFFIYNDGMKNSDIGLIHFTIKPVNDLPTLRDTVIHTMEDVVVEKTISDGLKTLTFDEEADPITFELIANVKHGELLFNPNGSFKFVPAKNYAGLDTFYYKSLDLEGASNISSVVFNILPVNDAPQAMNREFSFNEDETYAYSYLNSSNPIATDVESDSLIFEKVSGPKHGILQLETNGTFKYQPNENFYGTDSILFKVRDTALFSNTASLIFTILPVNDAPVAFNKSVIMNEDDEYELSNITNINTIATDIEDDSLIFEKISDPKHGILQWESNGRFKYKPDSNYYGNDQFFFKVKDSTLYSNNASISFNINPINDPPTILDSVYYFQIKESDRFDFDFNCVIFNDVIDIDNDKQQLKIAISKFSQFNGDLIQSNAGFFTYQPNKNTIGLDSLKIKVLDLESNSKEVTVIFRTIKDNPFDNSNNILLFPNPANNFIRLKDLTIDQIFIQHINGLQFNNIPFHKIGNDIIVNCVGLPSGTYIINLLYQNKLIGVKKFIRL